MKDLVAESLQEKTFTLSMLSGFAALSLILAAVGIYGVMSYSFSRRGREIGIRLALGAAPRALRHRFFSRALVVVASGAAAGMAGALAAGEVLASLLYGVDPRDPLTLAAAPAVVLSAAALAIWVPVLRHTRVDPMVTLRAE
jgi:ABC-type antimicrobial peptide transport system permease subunit